MIISHEHKFIFVKTRKTAGSSIEKYLFDYLNDNDVCTGSPRDNTPRLNNPWVDGHIGHELIRKQYPYEWKHYFKFAVDRNPWDKLVSFYFWYEKIKPVKVKRGFESFVKNPKNKKLNDWNMYTEKNELVVDALVDYSNLHETFLKLPIPYNNELLHTFVKADIRKEKNYIKMYNNETKDIVAERFSNVIDYFGYTF
jgi:hypothetical protein